MIVRTCTHVRLPDHVRVDNLHDRCKLTSLEKRHQVQVLLIKYRESKDVSLHKVFHIIQGKVLDFLFKTDMKVHHINAVPFLKALSYGMIYLFLILICLIYILLRLGLKRKIESMLIYCS